MNRSPLVKDASRFKDLRPKLIPANRYYHDLSSGIVYRWAP
jgi:hypothetical protein